MLQERPALPLGRNNKLADAVISTRNITQLPGGFTGIAALIEHGIGYALPVLADTLLDSEKIVTLRCLDCHMQSPLLVVKWWIAVVL